MDWAEQVGSSLVSQSNPAGVWPGFASYRGHADAERHLKYQPKLSYMP